MFFILTINTVLSQAPQTISWQGIIQDGQGNNLNGQYNLTIRFFDVATGGTSLWSETHNNVQINDGLANIIIGSITNLNLPFDKEYWLEIQVGNNNPLPRIKLTSVPYSLYSKKASGIIENDSLVLKDSRGITRMVLNPNTGTFKMMNNDTVWYELSVQSPPKFTIQNESGTYTTTKDGKEATYADNGTLLRETEEKSFTNDNGHTVHQVTTKYYGDGKVNSEFETKTYDDEFGTKTQERTTYYDNDGNKYVEYASETAVSGILGSDTEIKSRTEYNKNGTEASKTVYTYSHGKLISEEHFQNGKKTSEKWYDEQKTKNLIYNSSGSINRTVTQYQDRLQWSYSTGTQASTFTQTENGWNYQIGSNPNSLTIINKPNGGYQFSLMSGYQTNPSFGLIPDEYGGYINLTGSAVFQSDIVTNHSVYGNSAYFNGDLYVSGNKNFKIDHPDDPENKDLYHACIESDEVLNQYTGNIVTDENGIAVVTLPDYVQKINIDFRYQLTVIGQFAQAIISKEINNNQFEIRTDKPNVKVSWLITAKRNDKYMQEHPFLPVRPKNKAQLNRIRNLINNGELQNGK